MWLVRANCPHLPIMHPSPAHPQSCRLTRRTAPDHRKLQPRLLTHWPTIPIEIDPLALAPVRAALRALGSPLPTLRTGPMDKAGPLKTDQANFIIDAPFPTLLLPRDSTTQNPTSTTQNPTSTTQPPASTPQTPDPTPATQVQTSLHNTLASPSPSPSTSTSSPPPPGRWEASTLARAIKLIEGVLSVGLFVGENGDEAAAAGRKSGGQKPVAAYFGMADGGVVVRSGGVDRRVE